MYGRQQAEMARRQAQLDAAEAEAIAHKKQLNELNDERAHARASQRGTQTDDDAQAHAGSGVWFV